MKKSIWMVLTLALSIAFLAVILILPTSALSVSEGEYEDETVGSIPIEVAESELYQTFEKLCSKATDVVIAKHIGKINEWYYNDEYGGLMQKSIHTFEVSEVSMGSLAVGDELQLEIELSIFSTLDYGYHELDNLPYVDEKLYILVLHRASPSSAPELVHKTLVIPDETPSEGVLYGSRITGHISLSFSAISDWEQLVDYVIDIAQGEIVIDDRVVVDEEVYLEEEDSAALLHILSKQNWSDSGCLVDDFDYGLKCNRVSWIYSASSSYLVCDSYGVHGVLSHEDALAFKKILRKYFDDESLDYVEVETDAGIAPPEELPFGSLEQNGIYMPPLEIVDKVVIETAYGVDYPVTDNELIEELYSAITGLKYMFYQFYDDPIEYEYGVSFYVGENKYSFCLSNISCEICAFVLDPSEYGRHVIFVLDDYNVGRQINDLCASYCYDNSPKKPLEDYGILLPTIDEVREVNLSLLNQDIWLDDKEFIKIVLPILNKMEISYYGSSKGHYPQGYSIQCRESSSYDSLYFGFDDRFIAFNVAKGADRYAIVFEASKEELQELNEYCDYYWFEVLGLPAVLDTDNWYDEEIWETCDGETDGLVESQIGTDIVSDEVTPLDESNTQTCDTSSGGCGSTLVGVAIIPAMLAAGLVLTKKRR